RAETEVLLEALAGFYAHGGSVDWSGVFPGQRRRVELATYAWQRRSYWVSPRARVDEDAATRGRGAGLLGKRIPIAGNQVVYENAVSVQRQPWLTDHRVAGEVVVPAAGIVEQLRAAFEGTTTELRSIAVTAPLRLSDSEERKVQLVVTRGAQDHTRAVLY